MKFGVLGSGSSGNAVLITGCRSAILVDAGFSARQLEERMAAAGIRATDLQAIILTHEHGDHIRGAGILARKHRIPILATAGTLHGGRSILGKLPSATAIESGREFRVGEFCIHPFAVSHDAADPVAYTVDAGGIRMGICTDTGYITHLVRERLRECHGLVLEMNHDLRMLMAGSYPWDLKQRIRSRKGHLSNDDAGAFITEIWHPGMRNLVLAHLSRENNLPDLASVIAEQALHLAGGSEITEYRVAMQDTVTEMFDLGTREQAKEILDD